jgi:hypothetical protein
LNPYPPISSLWFFSDRPWYKRWETWLVVTGIFGVGFFVGRGRR